MLNRATPRRYFRKQAFFDIVDQLCRPYMFITYSHWMPTKDPKDGPPARIELRIPIPCFLDKTWNLYWLRAALLLAQPLQHSPGGQSFTHVFLLGRVCNLPGEWSRLHRHQQPDINVRHAPCCMPWHSWGTLTILVSKQYHERIKGFVPSMPHLFEDILQSFVQQLQRCYSEPRTLQWYRFTLRQALNREMYEVRFHPCV